jgi:pimeloyl-ACP methyl ester carboxylesterase
MKSAFPVVFGGLLLLACGGEDPEPSGGSSATTCMPNETSLCSCPGGETGTQHCGADGASLTVCACDGTTTSGAGGATMTPGEPSPEPAGGASTNAPLAGSDAPADPPTGSADPTETDDLPVTSNGSGVTVPGVECGSPLSAGTLLPPIVTLGGRDVYIDYACGKAPGTPTTFILNLHGTMSLEGGKIYQRGYFPAYQFTESHDFIVATPKAVGSQWGNGDGGADEPHVMAVIAWVYENFAALDIQQMWIVGHSWGAMYARSFACKAELADRVHGVVLMSGGSTMPACADRLAALGTVGETDIVPGELAQGPTASGHGCGASTTSQLGNNVVTDWPSCDPGWVHRNYLMLGKGHGFDPIDWPDEGMVEDLADAILATRI